MRKLRSRCPAAQLVHPPTDEPSIVCGVLRLANEGQTINGFRHRAEADPLMSGTEMAGTVQNFCCGTGVPGSACSYESCVIWQAHREAEWERRGIRDDAAYRPREDIRAIPAGAV